MTTNNKILTVSYGTFSCTLEGFEDNFGTMKAIAEYFRDLAADDRYFGAEPPQPDADMLTRIAEREISRRVEAREHEGRIFLSASENAEAPAPVAAAAPLAAAAVVATDKAEDTTADAPADVLALEPKDQTEDAAGAEQAVADTNVEADTVDASENDAVALEETETEAPVEDLSIDIDTSDDDVPSEADAAVTEATDAEQPDTTEEAPEADAITETETSAEEAEADIDAFFAASEDDAEIAAPAEEDIEVAETVAPEPPAAPAADSIAAKLQRIRAVVSQSQHDASEDELFEDEHAEDVSGHVDTPAILEDIADASEAEAEDVVAQAAQDIEAALDIDDADIAGVEEDSLAQDEDELSALMARLDTDTSAPEGEAPEVSAGEADEDMGRDTLAALMAADEEPDDTSGTGENLFASADTAEAVAEDAEIDDQPADADDAVAAEGGDAEAEEAEAQSPVRARVIKVKRADIDAALASGQLEQVEDDDADLADKTTLSDDEEAELLAELAQVEAELPTQSSVADDAAQADDAETAEEDTTPDAQPAQVAETKPQDVQDDDVSRLMAEAENQMEEPESSNRRDAFAHLKAAVKAKKADADIGNDSIKDEGAFRSDLAEVVKPRRPEVNATRDARPEKARPAPLKLVAEQRVDVDSAPKGPVRPRRVAAPQDAVENVEGAETFADYAAELGAHDLPALLEAAASYLSFVEGQDQFSRPQLMTKVRQIEQDDFSREDSLRSFGQLLRSGKIEKISGGRFAVTGDIGYRPEHRAAG